MMLNRASKVSWRNCRDTEARGRCELTQLPPAWKGYDVGHYSKPPPVPNVTYEAINFGDFSQSLDSRDENVR